MKNRRRVRPVSFERKRVFSEASKMNASATLRRLLPLLALPILAALTGCGGVANTTTTTTPPTQTTPPAASLSSVQHIIFLAEENRSFDHYFGKMNDYRSAAPFNLPRSVNGLPDDCSPTTAGSTPWTTACSAMNLSPNSEGVPTTPIYAFHLQTACIDGLSPDWIVGHWDFNEENPSSDSPGTMGIPTPGPDGFVVSGASAAVANGENDVEGIRAMGYYTGTDLPYHYWLATEFAMSDSWFAPAATRTQPNRYYMMGATSGGYAYPYMAFLGRYTRSCRADTPMPRLSRTSWTITGPPGMSSSTLRFRSLLPTHRLVPCPRSRSSTSRMRTKNQTVPRPTYRTEWPRRLN
jgi:phospholipase C